MEFLTSLNWGEVLGIVSAFILAFDRLSKLTPTDADNKVVAALQKVFTVLGLRVTDR